MINLDIIPQIDKSKSSETSNGSNMAQLIIFYIGVICFICVCMIPPFTFMLPIVVPFIMVICAFVNFAFFGKFLEAAGNRVNENMKKMKI